MKALIVYDSVYGNTEKIARAVGGAIAGDVAVRRASEVDPAGLAGLDLLVVGSPTYGGRPTPPMRDFLDRIRSSALAGTRVAAFDTRVPARWVAIFGYAAGGIARELKRRGATLAGSPEGFFVEGREGPLRAGETERAATWAQAIARTTP
jgi:flavodoxin